MLGIMMYLMTTTQPNIVSAIAVPSRYNHDSSNEHMLTLNGVLRYLYGTKNWCLSFGEDGQLRLSYCFGLGCMPG